MNRPSNRARCTRLLKRRGFIRLSNTNRAGGLPVSCSFKPDVNPYKYGSKHLDTRHGLNLYDFEARLHAPDIARFLSPDPLADIDHGISPYVYCRANPIMYIDPSGMIEWPVPETYGNGTRKHSNNFKELRGDRYHKGIDINIGYGDNDLGAPVFATHDGTVVRVGKYTDKNPGGNRVMIQSEGNKVSTFYMHLNDFAEGIEVGAHVIEGQTIGYVGKSGYGKLRYEKYGPHLHYEVYVNGDLTDPTDGAGLIDTQKILDGGSGKKIYTAGELPTVEVTAKGRLPALQYIKIMPDPINTDIILKYSSYD